MIRPLFWRIMTRETAFERKNKPLRFTARVASHSSSVMSAMLVPLQIPAQFTRTSILPKVLKISSASELTATTFLTSSDRAWHSPPRALSSPIAVSSP